MERGSRHARRDALAHHDRQRHHTDGNGRAHTVHAHEQQRGDQIDHDGGDQRAVSRKLCRRADHALRDAGLDQHLGKPRAEDNDDDRTGVLHPAALQDLGLDVVHADAGQRRP